MITFSFSHGYDLETRDWLKVSQVRSAEVARTQFFVVKRMYSQLHASLNA